MMSHSFIRFFLLTTLCLLSASSHLSPDEMRALVHAHALRVEPMIDCSIPLPRVIHVETLEQRATPRATILHRCGRFSGCCRSLTEECVAKHEEKVPLYFSVGPHLVGSGSQDRVVVKMMTNHTECHCVERSVKRRKRMERRVKRKEKCIMRRRAMRGDRKGVVML